MKQSLIVILALLTSNICFGQVTGCFQKKSRHYRATITLEGEGTYTHTVTMAGHLAFTSIEQGTYTSEGDSILLQVTAHGIDEKELKSQVGSLTRIALAKGNTFILLAQSGDRHEKMRRVRCRKKALPKE
jgi:hypothetical protein